MSEMNWKENEHLIDYTGLKSPVNHFRRFNESTTVLNEIQEFVAGVTDWAPTKKYAFFHQLVPMDIINKDPLLAFIHERFGKIQPWVLMVPGGVLFEFHTDPSKGAALNFAISSRESAMTLFNHSRHFRRGMENILPLHYGKEGQFVLLNNMKTHGVLNYGHNPIFTFTIPCVVMKDDFQDIMKEYDELCNLEGDYTYRDGSGLKLPDTNKLTPKHLELMIFNKVFQIMMDNGFSV